MKEIRKIVKTVMNCLESGGFDDVQAKIAEHLGAPVDGYTVVIVAGDYDRELMRDEGTDGIDSHEWTESIQSYGWDPDAEQIQQARQEAQSSALTYGEGLDRIPACFCATIEDERDYYLIIGLKVIGPDAEAGRLELTDGQVVEYLDSVFECLNSNADEGEEDDYEDDDYEDDGYEEDEYEGDEYEGDEYEGDEYEDDEYEDDDGFEGAVEVYKSSGDPILAGDSEGEEEDFGET